MKVCVLGLGNMGQSVISHLKQCPEISHIVGYDIDLDKANRVANEYGISLQSKLDAILCDESIKLAFVATSNHVHKELVLSLLKKNKSVMCEKPMAVNLDDSTEMVKCAQSMGSFLQIGFELRYSKLYLKIKEWIDNGLLGEPVNTHCNYICSEFHGKGSWRNLLKTGGAMVGEKLSHYIDLSRWWINEKVSSVYAACSANVVPYYEVRDNYHMLWKFKNGKVGQMTFMMAPASFFGGDPLSDVINIQKDDGHELKYQILGTKGFAETDVFHRTIKRWQFSDDPKCLKSELVEVIRWGNLEDHSYFHNTTDQTKDIVWRVANSLPPKTSASDSLETMKLCFAVEDSVESGKVVDIT